MEHTKPWYLYIKSVIIITGHISAIFFYISKTGILITSIAHKLQCIVFGHLIQQELKFTIWIHDI